MNDSDETVYLSAGSNLGARKKILILAIRRLSRTLGIHVIRVSQLYETEPWGRRKQPYFLNCIIELKTLFSPMLLLRKLKDIESNAGREPEHDRWDPRTLDLDIILFGDVVMNTQELTIPHAQLTRRQYILQPLATLCPDFIIPSLGKTVNDVLKSCKDTSSVVCIRKEWIL